MIVVLFSCCCRGLLTIAILCACVEGSSSAQPKEPPKEAPSKSSGSSSSKGPDKKFEFSFNLGKYVGYAIWFAIYKLSSKFVLMFNRVLVAEWLIMCFWLFLFMAILSRVACYQYYWIFHWVFQQSMFFGVQLVGFRCCVEHSLVLLECQICSETDDMTPVVDQGRSVTRMILAIGCSSWYWLAWLCSVWSRSTRASTVKSRGKTL